jgi:hypothetical protein
MEDVDGAVSLTPPNDAFACPFGAAIEPSLLNRTFRRR